MSGSSGSSSSSAPPKIAEIDGLIVEETVTRKSLVPTATLSSDRSVRPCLVVLAGPDQGEVHRLAFGRSVVGRGRAANVRVEEESISRQHAEFVVDRDGVTLADLKSANGTFVNGEEITKPVLLEEGDRVRLGATVLLKFTLAAPVEEAFQRQLHGAAMRDALTGAFNRAYLMQRLESELAYAVRHGQSLGVLMIDADHFKSINDTHGHLAGDHVLAQIVARVTHTVRTEDVVARYGGEEFCIVCRGVPLVGCTQAAERVRAAIASAPFDFEGKRLDVTVSVGLATFPEIPVTTPMQIIASADAALLRAKRGGRNRVVVASADDDVPPPPTTRFMP